MFHSQPLVLFSLSLPVSVSACSAPSGHQREPQRLGHAHAPVGGGRGFGCVCHLQIQEVKCWPNVTSAHRVVTMYVTELVRGVEVSLTAG